MGWGWGWCVANRVGRESAVVSGCFLAMTTCVLIVCGTVCGLQTHTRVSNARNAKLVDMVNELKRRYGALREKLRRSNDRLRRSHADLRRSKDATGDVARQLQRAQDQHSVAREAARQKQRQLANEHAFKLAQEVALREAAEAKLVEAYRALSSVRQTARQRDALQGALLCLPPWLAPRRVRPARTDEYTARACCAARVLRPSP